MDEHLGRGGHGQGQTGASVREAGDGGCGRGIGHAALDQQLGDGRGRHGADADPGTAAADGVEQQRLVVGAEHEHRAGRWLLERLEQRVLGVGVESLGRRDDGDPDAALERQQGKVGDQRACLIDADLTPGAGRREGMDIGVVAMIDLAAGGAVAAGPIVRVIGQAQEAGRQVERQRRLARSSGAGDEHRAGRPLRGDRPGDDGKGSRLTAGPEAGHERQASGVAALRVEVRRLGLASAESAPAAAAASALGASVAAVLRVEVRRLGLASAASAPAGVGGA